MRKIAFKTQLQIGIAILVVCCILSFFLHNGIFHNIGWIAYGLLFVINPVWPKMWDYADHKKLKRGMRIGGFLAILIGLITRFGA